MSENITIKEKNKLSTKKTNILRSSCYQEFDVMRAGKGNINILTHQLMFSHNSLRINNGSSPIFIKNIYNSKLIDLDYLEINMPDTKFTVTLPKFCMGKGWKLNIQQYLVRENFKNKLNKNKISNRYIYINGEGEEVIFEECFYCLIGDTKKYLRIDEISIETSGALVYGQEDKNYIVTREINSKSDLVLEVPIDEFKGIERINRGIIEVENIKQQIKQMNDDIKNLIEQKKYLGEQVNKRLHTKNVDEFSFDIQNQGLNNALNKEKKALEELMVIDEDLQVVIESYKTESDIDIDEVHEKKAIAEQKILETEESIKITNLSIRLCQAQTDAYYNQLQGIISNYEMESARIDEMIEEYEKSINELRYQSSVYETHIPTYFIKDKNGIKYAFAQSTQENIFKIIAIIDGYDNALSYVYEGEKLIKLITSKNEDIIFEMKDELILKIVNSDGKDIRFEYDSCQMTKIIYNNNYQSLYGYHQKNLQLSTIVCPSGYGICVDYLENIIEISEISAIKSVKTDIITSIEKDLSKKVIDEITYKKKLSSKLISDCKRESTVINKYNVHTKYIFTEEGNLKTKYHFNITDNIEKNREVEVYSFSIDSCDLLVKKTEKYSNYLFSSTIKKNIDTSEEEKKIGYVDYLGSSGDGGKYFTVRSTENVLGTTLYGRTDGNSSMDINDYSFTNNNSSSIEFSINPNYIERLNNENKEVLIFSVWAKINNSNYSNKWDVRTRVFKEKESISFVKEESSIVKHEFEIEANIEYCQNDACTNFECGETSTQIISNSFDPNQTGWQLCSIPIFLADKKVKSINAKIVVDVPNAKVQLEDISLQDADFECYKYDVLGRLIKYENSFSEKIKEYTYNDNLLEEIEHISTNKNDELITYTERFEYSSDKRLKRKVLSSGEITEFTTDIDEEMVSLIEEKYHIEEPTKKYSKKKVLRKDGKESFKVNCFGDKVYEYKYDSNTGLLSDVIDNNHNVISCGYDDNDELLGLTITTADGTNENILKYNKGFLTNYKHNKVDYNFEYETFGRVSKIKVAGVEYKDNVYKTNQPKNSNDPVEEVTTTYGNGNVVKKCINRDGNDLSLEYKNNKTDDFCRIKEVNYASNGQILNTYNFDDEDQIKCLFSYEKNKIVKKEFLYGGFLEYYINTNYKTKIELDPGDTSKSLAFSLKRSNIVRVTTSEYDRNNQIVNVRMPNGIVNSLQYDKLGRINKTSVSKNENELSKEYDYAQKGAITNSYISGETIFRNDILSEKYSYVYDEKGNLIEIGENGLLIARYEYDSAARLKREDNYKLNKTTLFSYDSGGNIRYKRELPFTLDIISNINEAVVKAYSYVSEGWRDQMIAYDGERVGDYDAIGNPKTYRNKIAKWSHVRRLDEFDGIKYKYNSDNIRLSKTVNGIITDFYVDDQIIYAQEKGNELLYFNFDVNGINGFTFDTYRADKKRDEFVYKKNILGDVLSICKYDMTEIVKYIYDAWGNHETEVLMGNEFVNVKVLHTVGSNLNISAEDIEIADYYSKIASINPYRYRSYYYDEETGFYYLNSRYYDPEVGRFINADDVTYLDAKIINGLNLYAYCCNNPILYIDPTGTSLIVTLVLAGIIGAMIGTSVSIATQIIDGGGLESVSPLKVLLDAALGALSGVLVFTGLGSGFLGFAAGTISAFVGSIGHAAIDEKDFSDGQTWGGIIFSTLVAGVGFKAGNVVVDKLAKVGIKTVSNSIIGTGIMNSVTIASVAKDVSVSFAEGMIINGAIEKSTEGFWKNFIS